MCFGCKSLIYRHFLLLVGCLFTLTVVPFKAHDFDFDEAQFIYISYAFGIVPNKPLPNLRSQRFASVFFQEFYSFNSSI